MFTGEMTWRCLSGLRLVRYPPDSNMCDNKQEFLRLLMARSRFVIKMVNTYDKPIYLIIYIRLVPLTVRSYIM